MRYTDAIIAKDKAYASHSPILDAKYGGQMGYLPRIGGVGADGKLYEEWISGAHYIKQNVIPVVLRYPRFFDYMPDKAYFIAGYKAMIEEHPIRIEGFNSSTKLDVDEVPVGGAGEMMQEPTNATRERSNPSFTIVDKANRSMQRLINKIIRYGIKDPDTKKPLASQFMDTMTDAGGIYTPDFYSGMVLFIEPDVTQQVVVDAWLCVNFYPLTDGPRTGKRDLTSGGEKNEMTIDFAAFTMNSESVQLFAQTILPQLTVLKKNPDTDFLMPIDGIDASVTASNYGFNRQ